MPKKKSVLKNPLRKKSVKSKYLTWGLLGAVILGSLLIVSAYAIKQRTQLGSEAASGKKGCPGNSNFNPITNRCECTTRNGSTRSFYKGESLPSSCRPVNNDNNEPGEIESTGEVIPGGYNPSVLRPEEPKCDDVIFKRNSTVLDSYRIQKGKRVTFTLGADVENGDAGGGLKSVAYFYEVNKEGERKSNPNTDIFGFSILGNKTLSSDKKAPFRVTFKANDVGTVYLEGKVQLESSFGNTSCHSEPFKVEVYE